MDWGWSWTTLTWHLPRLNVLNEAKSVAGYHWLRLSPSVALLRGQVWSSLGIRCQQLQLVDRTCRSNQIFPATDLASLAAVFKDVTLHGCQQARARRRLWPRRQRRRRGEGVLGQGLVWRRRRLSPGKSTHLSYIISFQHLGKFMTLFGKFSVYQILWHCLGETVTALFRTRFYPSTNSSWAWNHPCAKTTSPATSTMPWGRRWCR